MHATEADHPTILLIEDDEILREEAQAWLNFEGYHALTAVNGVQGVRLALLHRPALIVCDIMMPELDGFGVLLEVRSHPETLLTPFIFLTALSERSDVRFGMQLGADDYVTKPFTRQELLAAIEARLLRQQVQENESQKSLEELRRVLNYTLPHELRTPLNAILGFADLLAIDAATLPRPAIVDIANHIVHSGRRLHHLIENYLVFAQIEFLRHDLTQAAPLRAERSIGVGTAVRRAALAAAASYGRERDLRLEVDAAEPAVGVGNQDWEKIVFELIDNAFKFSPQGSPVVITTSTHDDEYVLAIQDQGRGMSAVQIEQIAAYAQFNRKLYEQSGAGLGLAISRGLVDLCGGTFELHSELAQGTHVRVVLRTHPAGTDSDVLS